MWLQKKKSRSAILNRSGIKLLPHSVDMVFIATLLSVLFSGFKLINSDGDLGRHLIVGQYILDTYRIPKQDIFSFTMTGHQLIPHEWLSEVLFALSYRLLGMDGVILLCALILASTMGLIYRQILQRSGLLFLSMAVVFLAGIASSFHWIARPHLWTMLMVVVWVGGMERLRRDQYAYWWTLPIFMCIWVNLHGAFIVGFVILFIYLIGRIWEYTPSLLPLNSTLRSLRIWLFVGGISIIASFINPSGWNIWANSVGYIANRFLIDHTIEYFSPSFHDPVLWPFAFIILLTLFLLGINRLSIKPTHLLLLICWIAMGLYSTRNIPLFALIAAPILAEGSADYFRLYMPSTGKVGGGIYSTIVVVLTIVLLYGGQKIGRTLPGDSYSQKYFPVEATRWLKTNPPSGNMYNNFIWGGYLLYRLWPEQKVFIDGQTDFYGEDLTRQYISISLGEVGWQDILVRHHIRWAIVPTNSLIARLLQRELDWKTVYQDETAVILEKQ
jgi:hypothetical protein